MSMLSSQIDELRELADDIESRYGYPTAVKALRDAADTIWELRDDLQRANAAVQDAEHDESMAWDRIRKLEAENAKLRELLIDAYKDMDAWQMVIANSNQWGYGKGCLERLCKLREAMRELGIETGDE